MAISIGKLKESMREGALNKHLSEEMKTLDFVKMDTLNGVPVKITLIEGYTNRDGNRGYNLGIAGLDGRVIGRITTRATVVVAFCDYVTEEGINPAELPALIFRKVPYEGTMMWDIEDVPSA